MKIGTLVWFLRRPKFYAQAWKLVLRRLWLRNDEHGKEESLLWCLKNAVSEKEALAKLLPNIKEFDAFENIYPDRINEGNRKP